ncbi:MAG: DEAD/DEAH box helicase [Polyangiaceae bacterium]
MKKQRGGGEPSAVEPGDDEVLGRFSRPVAEWVRSTFGSLTRTQRLGMGPIIERRSTLLLAPTGSGKTLAAFLAAIERVMFGAPTNGAGDLKILYVSPLKALAVDVERNLRAPIVGIAQAASRLGVGFHEPSVFVRSGDTAARDRAVFSRSGADILITTPESLYLMLTSEPARRLATVDTVIVDEIHAMAGTKRGAHLWLSLERLEALRAPDAPPLQRIGLSATVRPLDTIARALAGYSAPNEPRPVSVVDAGTRRPVEVTVEVPVEDLRAVSDKETGPGPRGTAEGTRSIWSSIYPRIVELIRAYTTTLVFVNNRRLAERLAAALNEVAGEELALAHHGSVAHDRRQTIEDRLKSGTIPAIVATSSLELGIDMGAIDLVVQVEAPPSVSAGLQRIGRAGHRASAISKGSIMPKFRADLLACAATARAMTEGAVEATAVPENPLDVLAQQIVAHASMGPVRESDLYDLVRRAAPFVTLPRTAYEGVLDMLAGRYPSDEFSELRPRIVWDRVAGIITARQGAKRIAILSGGTIPDRGLFGVFLAGAEKPMRIGELDEEMVFESRVGEVFLLGASSWRITEITHDRVLAIPAPGEPGKMPFWHGDRPGRPAELGRRIGALARRIASLTPVKAEAELSRDYALDTRAAKNLVTYVHEQKQATGEVPSDEVVVIERFHDELGDQRVCILCPLGAKVLAPWAMAVTARLRDERGLDIDTIWTDDGIVFRVADVETAPDIADFIPAHDEIEDLMLRGLDRTALFAARFRENAARALLLPRRSATKRQPLWSQRKRASELLAVASRYASFPLVLETFRECLRDALDMPSLVNLLRDISVRAVRLVSVDRETPSPFASSLLFSYVANFIYDGDAPLAERRAQALALDQDRLRELWGEVELRDLLDEEAIAEAARSLSHATSGPLEHIDRLHDLLLAIGDMTRAEIAARVAEALDSEAFIAELVRARRAVIVTIAGEERVLAVEDVARYRDALGVAPPAGVPAVFLERCANALQGLLARYARTHGPFTVDDLIRRFGLGADVARTAALSLVALGKLVHGSFTPNGPADEFCDAEVLRIIKRKSLARLRKAIEPVPAAALVRWLAHAQGVRPVSDVRDTRLSRGNPEALVRALEQLEGLALPATVWFDDVLPSRVAGFTPSLLDELTSSGEVIWRGVEPIATTDGRVAFHFPDRLHLLGAPAGEPSHPLAEKVLEALRARGAVFFHELAATVAAFPNDVLEALWDLVFAGLVTNDTTQPLRSRFGLSRNESQGRPARLRAGAARRPALPGSEGRWSLLAPTGAAPATELERRSAMIEQLFERGGVVTRESVLSEGIAGGFGAVYPLLRALEESGRARRGYFIEALGATQFARPGIEERLRALREPSAKPEAFFLAAADPANPFGATLSWPASLGDRTPRPTRGAGAHVVLFDGVLLGFLARGDQALATSLPTEEPDRAMAMRSLAHALGAWVDGGPRRALSLATIDGEEASKSALAPALRDAGFTASSDRMIKRR